MADRALRTINELKTPQEIIGAGEEVVRGDYLESSLLDVKSRKYLNELAPFSYSKDKKVESIDELPSKDQSLYYSLMNHFEKLQKIGV